MKRTSSSSTVAVEWAWVAAATAVLDLVVLAVFHVLPTEVDPVTDPASDYAVSDYGTLSLLATLGVGLGALALMAVLQKTRRRSMVGLVLLGLFGLAKVCAGILPYRRGRRDHSQRQHSQRLRHGGVLRSPRRGGAAIALARARRAGRRRAAHPGDARAVRQRRSGRLWHRAAGLPGAVVDLGAGHRGGCCASRWLPEVSASAWLMWRA